MPTNDEILKLVNINMSNYKKSLEENNISYFYNDIAQMWKNQTSESEMEKLLFTPTK
jgi:hypothetical protein